MSLIGGLFLHLSLNWLYSYGYSTKTALGIMGGVPIVVLALLLPFLKMAVPTVDVYTEPVATEPITKAGEFRTGTMTNPTAEPITQPIAEPTTNIAGTRITPEEDLTKIEEVVEEYMENQTEFNTGTPIHSIPFQVEQLQTEDPNANIKGIIQLEKNIFGGYDIEKDGRHIMTSMKNINEGQDFYDENMQKFQSSKPNVFEGSDYYSKENLLQYRTIENSHGGYDIYDENMKKVGYTMPLQDNNFILYGENGKQIGQISDNKSYFS